MLVIEVVCFVLIVCNFGVLDIVRGMVFGGILMVKMVFVGCLFMVDVVGI